MNRTVDTETVALGERLVAAVLPWLPDAKIDTLSFDSSCGCYSEWTQEPCRLEVTFRAPRPDSESDDALGKLIGVIEDRVREFANANLEWKGCECCGEDYISLWVRVIREKGEIPQ